MAGNNSVFEISTVIDQLIPYNESLIVRDGDSDVYGTANPYQFNLFSDLITNPSSVSISEFQKMVYTQPVLSAGLTILTNLVKNELGSYQSENPKYQQYIDDTMENLARPFDDIITDMMTFLWAGFFVGEKRYESDGQYIYVKDIEPRPAQSIIYRVDSQGHLKDDGIIQYYFNNLWTGYGNLLAFNAITADGQQYPNPYASRGDFDYPWRTVWAQPIGTIVIPKDKCIHLAYKGLDGLTSPYGRSILRAAYDSYLVGAELVRILRNAANFKASPIPVIIVDPNQTNTEAGQEAFDNIAQELDTLGDPGGGNAYLLLKGIRDKSIFVDKLDSTASLDDLVKIKEYFDKMQLTSILYPSELAGLSDKGSYALGKTQQDLLGRNVRSIANMVRECLMHQWIKPMLKLNFNEQKDFGKFAPHDNVAEDVALNMDKLNALMSSGIKLKADYIVKMLDVPEQAIESINNPIIDNNGDNRDTNSNFVRARRTGGV